MSLSPPHPCTGAWLASDATPPLEETSAAINADHVEGREQITVTRATARALYFALFDTLNVVAGREYEPQDALRLERALTTFAGIGWPLEADGA